MERVVTSLPLAELHVEDGKFLRGPTLDREAVLAYMRSQGPTIAVASVGASLKFVSGAEAYDLWKRELTSRLVDGDRFQLEDFPDERAYVAVRWAAPDGRALVVFEQHH